MVGTVQDGASCRDCIDYEVNILHPRFSVDGNIDYGDSGTDDIDCGVMAFLRMNNPNGLAPELYHKNDESWLRLAVAKGAYGDATNGDPDKNDRCELRDRKLRLGTPVLYTFDLRADEGFPEVEARCVVAQIKAPFYDANGGSPLFALRIDHGRFVATVEHLYEAKDAPISDGRERSIYLKPYASPGSCAPGVRAMDHHVFGNSRNDFKELQVRALLATDDQGLPPHLESEFLSCTTGVRVIQEFPLPDDIYRWWRFSVGLAPTETKDEDGIVQLFVSDPGKESRLVATAWGEFGHVGESDPETNTGPKPGTAYQYFKIGPYRDKWNIWADHPAAVHVRNIKRSIWQRGSELRATAAQASRP